MSEMSAEKMELKKNMSFSNREDPSPFDLLPNEVLLKIVKMAATSGDCQSVVPIKHNHNFIARVLSKVSNRFKILSSDQALWRNVYLEDDSPGVLKEVRDNFLGSFTEVLWIRLNFLLNNEDELAHILRTISSRCSMLQTLILTFPEEMANDEFKRGSVCYTALHKDVTGVDLRYCYGYYYMNHPESKDYALIYGNIRSAVCGAMLNSIRREYCTCGRQSGLAPMRMITCAAPISFSFAKVCQPSTCQYLMSTQAYDAGTKKRRKCTEVLK